MTKTLILTLVFPPDSVSTARIVGDMAVGLHARGHDVTVLTTYPHYNRDHEAEFAQPMRNHWGPILKKSVYHGIPVYHAIMPRKGANKSLRMLTWVGFHFISTLAGMRVISGADVIIAPSPPLTIGLSAWLLSAFHHAPYIYNVKELYPDIAVKLGMIRNRWLIKLLTKIEDFIYKRAAAIVVIGPRMREQVLNKKVNAKKLFVIPDSVDIEGMHPMPKENDFSRAYQLDQRFVISYAGNMGPAQGLESFIEAANLLRDDSRIHFLMMGNGIHREQLAQRVHQLHLKNFSFLPYQPYSLMPQVYAASDLCFVPLAAGIGTTAIPSKVYQSLACERAVIASADPHSELATIVTDSTAGWVVPPGDAVALAEVVKQAHDQPELLRHMGKQGRRYVVGHSSAQAVVGRYDALISTLLQISPNSKGQKASGVQDGEVNHG